MRETADLWAYEREAREQGYTAVCGVDEAGAGPLMGPVYAAAVILPEDYDLPELNDSKKLTEKKREMLFPLIKERAIAWSVAWVEASEIDATDILSARMKAMQMAINGLSVTSDMALIDGNRDKGHSAAISTAHRCIVGGDGKSASIAAASVLAKVSRDHYVTEVLDKAYPQYQFARHKGYGTKLHYEMLDKYGPCPEHRRSFLKKMGGKAMSAVKPAPEKGGRSEGTWGEALAAEYLRQRGCRLAAHSYHCRFGEIDLIAWDGDVLCFVEVKTRSNTDMGLPREYVTPAKQRRLKKTALYYLCEKQLDCPARFDVAEVYADSPYSRENVRIEYLENAFE